MSVTCHCQLHVSYMSLPVTCQLHVTASYMSVTYQLLSYLLQTCVYLPAPRERHVSHVSTSNSAFPLPAISSDLKHVSYISVTCQLHISYISVDKFCASLARYPLRSKPQNLHPPPTILRPPPSALRPPPSTFGTIARNLLPSNSDR